MSEITIVTAYFDIGRSNWKDYERGTNKYISYFKFWAKINNNIIIYTNKELVEEILSIRRDFGLENKTTVIGIENVFNCDKNLYNKIKTITENEITQYFHFHKEIHRPEAWNAQYNFVTFLKFYFTNKAITDLKLTGTIAWLDFGFNHDGQLGLIDTNDFNFTWKYNFSSKIHLFSIKPLNTERPIFDIIRNLDTYILGGVMVGPANLWHNFYYLAYQSMISLLRCGFCDDDQTIALMCYYEKPELFEIHTVNYWFDGIRCFGGSHFKFNKTKKIINKPYKYYRYRARILLGDGHYKLAWKYFKKYLKYKIKGSLI